MRKELIFGYLLLILLALVFWVSLLTLAWFLSYILEPYRWQLSVFVMIVFLIYFAHTGGGRDGGNHVGGPIVPMGR